MALDGKVAAWLSDELQWRCEDDFIAKIASVISDERSPSEGHAGVAMLNELAEIVGGTVHLSDETAAALEAPSPEDVVY